MDLEQFTEEIENNIEDLLIDFIIDNSKFPNEPYLNLFKTSELASRLIHLTRKDIYKLK